MAETITINKPAPILTGSLTAFLNEIDKLGKGAVPTGFSGIDTSVYDPKVAQQTKFAKPLTSKAPSARLAGNGTLPP